MLFGFFLVNCYLFLWKNEEYKNFHSVIFYVLSFLCITSRTGNLVYSYMEAPFHVPEVLDGPELTRNVQLNTMQNIFDFFATYIMVVLGYNQLVSVVTLIAEINSAKWSCIKKATIVLTICVTVLSFAMVGILTVLFLQLDVDTEKYIQEIVVIERLNSSSSAILFSMLIVTLFSAFYILAASTKSPTFQVIQV